jgi:hypothetical protein
MRCTQFQGLSPEANDYLAANAEEVPLTTCPHCHEVIDWQYKSAVYKDASDVGMFDDGPKLLEYTLKDGTTVKEVVQAVPWSSGPVIFLALETPDGKIIHPWPESAIENA